MEEIITEIECLVIDKKHGMDDWTAVPLALAVYALYKGWTDKELWTEKEEKKK